MTAINSPPLFKTTALKKIFTVQKKRLYALQDINLTICQGETLGVVGESGCGKSTLGKILLRLETLTSGSVFFQDVNLNLMNSKEMRHLRCSMQMIFQDPYSSLNPRMTIENIIGEGLDIHRLASGIQRRQAIAKIVQQVSLQESMLNRYPNELSGGQRQRVGIARALIVNPSFLVCDEPLSALDMCNQQQIMKLLIDLKHERRMTYLFISHDIRAVSEISDRIIVMYLGRVVEHASASDLFISPQHPYTKALLAARPIPDPLQEKNRLRVLLNGDPPSTYSPPSGCPFHPRCPVAIPVCRKEFPQNREIGSNHFAACHRL